MRFWTELAFIMTKTSRWRKWCRRFRTSREGVPAVSAETDGEEEEEVEETLRRRAGTLKPVKPPQRRLRLWSSTRPRRWGIARIHLGLIQACRCRGNFTVPPGRASDATGSDLPARRQTVAKFVSETRWRETGRVVPQARAVRPGPNWRW
jgi:hypothetical protein